MIAFGHLVSAPFFDSTSMSSQYSELTVIKIEDDIQTLKYFRTYQQNQNRNVLLSSSFPFRENIADQRWTFEVENIVGFSWEKGSNSIEFFERQEGNETLTKYWFLHTFLPIYLTIEAKCELIHAGSVEIDNKPVLFIAPSYGGKSTLTDYFLKQGHVMVSDDRVPLKEVNSQIIAQSSYPYHRPYRKMEDLGVRVDKFMLESKELHKIYVLEPAEASAEVSFTRLKGIQSFSALQYNFDFSLELNKASSFELMAKIASKVPIYQISFPWDLTKLDKVYQAICKHSNQKETI